MLNKPTGLLSASRGEEVVTQLISEDHKVRGIFPVGRLDKDTEGLLLISNDGQLAHRLLAPKSHVPKRYLVQYEGVLSAGALISFQEGITLDDGEECLPAELYILPDSHLEAETEKLTIGGWAEVVLYEGKYHQVKRMMQAVGCRVMYLKRIAFGPLLLDTDLKPGDYRELNEEEVAALHSATTSKD
jgi:16S rRNA pseudouridine516 synthase